MFQNIGEELFYRTSSQAKEQLMQKVEAGRTATSFGKFRQNNTNYDKMRPA